MGSSIIRKIAAYAIPYKKDVKSFGREGSNVPLVGRVNSAQALNQLDNDDFDLQLRLYLQEITEGIDAVLEELDTKFLDGTVTLAVAPATTTTITDDRITTSSKCFLFATTATAGGATPVYAVATAGVITITHPASAAVDRTYNYLILV